MEKTLCKQKLLLIRKFMGQVNNFSYLAYDITYSCERNVIVKFGKHENISLCQIINRCYKSTADTFKL